MKFMGYDLFRKYRKESELQSSPQITQGNPQGPMSALFQDYVFRKVSGAFYEALREGIPIIDTAITRLISMNGTLKIIGDKAELVSVLEDFCLNVPVNDTQKGMQAFLQNFGGETFEQGFSISEFVATSDLKDIAGLRVADSKNIVYRRNRNGKAEPWYRDPSGQTARTVTAPGDLVNSIMNAAYGQRLSVAGSEERKLNPANLLYHSINNENSDPYGVSMIRSLEFVSQILASLQTSMKNVAERFGDPSYHVHYKGSKSGDDERLETRRSALQNAFNDVITAKRQGKSGDLVTAGSLDSDVAVKVIGHDGQILTYDVPLRHVLEQIVAKTNLPAWMLGIYWSTTERMATLEVEAALQDAKVRQLAMLPELIRLFSIVLSLRGYKWSSITIDPTKAGDWGIMFETPNLRDVVAQAQARFLNAQADMMGVAGSAGAATSIQLQTGASAEINGLKVPLVQLRHKSHAAGCGCPETHVRRKELGRPRPWPALDDVEARYEQELEYDWHELKEKVFTILGFLPAEDGKAVKADESQSPRFALTDAQRQAILDELKRYLDTYDPADPDSAIRYFYGQAVSLGFLEAVSAIREDKPILNILKNAETYSTLFRNGFSLVKDSATLAIKDDVIAALERHTLAGSNPLDAARELDKVFGDQNSDWERLARSEMSMAAETAKIDEWKEWDVKMVEFTPAPDACPICTALAGDYPIASCPVAVRDTHPRCRCSTRPAASEV